MFKKISDDTHAGFSIFLFTRTMSCLKGKRGIAVDTAIPMRDYQNVIRALSCMVRIGTEVLEICDVPVEIVDPVRLRPLVGNPKFA